MKFSIFATLAFLGLALASPAANSASNTATLPSGATCNKDGSMGNCQSGLCVQEENASTGTCQ
ncbi:uncharacterized protein AKAW2_40431S [Aspergillus luchuensis]|uniref:Uncharacterized protein n=7 Tax=Aspergillus subgen. Circumdati TaxID=2720871 RepID=A0A1L9NFX2_ASPTC|nr:hypothetical protein BO87DRAFT_456729 [Aspergillus neoniger CBS 115656]XP_025520633.1 hypothetical protein BO85DRAFT_482600 [Aspergillus piperis CBS 112811]XP_025545015.1 hypothetical protein BO79DRAFT_283579 [Aspergillus costaricaensis CBS 115574]XP_025563046.1 hypothetical protein BO88DRAFT_453693 [Aspergillus vadensis CBS 113365]XP_041542511.1 uncharacterized protein AKAW2_40431S [Aspergillus luchuensis]OJI88167.1 hypothetical protein ASPTUDRAFT_196507 [Aspergillus tubingensis CBS 134.48